MQLVPTPAFSPFSNGCNISWLVLEDAIGTHTCSLLEAGSLQLVHALSIAQLPGSTSGT
jgi:hypothetical protein